MPEPFDLSRAGAQPEHWGLDPEIAFLNHGSFGACPKPILELQSELRTELEREPIEFFLGGGFEQRLADARAKLGELVGADGDDLAFVTNATTGINTVLRSLRLDLDDEVVVTDQEYNACRNALDYVAQRSGARVVVAEIPFPIESAFQVVEAITSCLTERTRLVLIDHIVSPTGLVLPLAEVLEELRERGIDSLVDGAHAVGQVDIDLRSLGATYYTSNCHKWLCTPKGAAFLYVQRDRQPVIRPLVISHGANAQSSKLSRFRLEFDWQGTGDPTPFLCIAESIRFLGSLMPGGIPAVRERNRALALAARDVICSALGIAPPCPDDMVGALAAFPIPDGDGSVPDSPLFADPLRRLLLDKHRIEVPVMPWPAPPRRLLRISAQLYNSLDQYERLAEALAAELR